MNFTEISAEVLAIVKRPDKINDIRREINASVNFCCNDTECARDLAEGSFSLDGSLYTQSLPLSGFARFRKFSYLKPPAVRWYLSPTTPVKVFDNCKEACNSYYVAGADVVIKTSALHSSLLVGWYAFPPVLTDLAPTFWLLDASPYMIIDRAAAKVFANIGDDASASKHMAAFNTAWLSARADLASGTMP
jgi:hypothetical protein